MSLLKEERKYKDKMLVPYDDRLIPVSMKDISCFYTSDKSTRIYLRNGEVYPYAKTLEQIAASLDPDKFIRANKQYIVAKESVIDITVWYDSRLRLTLDVEVPEYIYISKNRAAEFKAWITNE
jgi:DNA-binding LytR/AlgR family response regulator